MKMYFCTFFALYTHNIKGIPLIFHQATFTICTYRHQYYITLWKSESYSGSSFLGALPPLEFLEVFLVVLDHVGEALYVVVCLLQQVDQSLVLLLVYQLPVALFILRLAHTRTHTQPGVTSFTLTHCDFYGRIHTIKQLSACEH